MKYFDAFRRVFNPALRHLLGLELTKITSQDSRWVGVGIRLWQK